MKRYSNFLITSCLLVALSCNVLDQEPESVISELNFYKTGADAEAAALGIYASFRDHTINVNSYLGPPTLGSDEAQGRGGTQKDLDEFALTPALNYSMWTVPYRTIARANDVLVNVPRITNAISEETRSRTLGTAYFFRAFCYYLLVRQYGGVPILAEPFTGLNSNFRPSRDSAPAVFDQIISDLQQAIDLLPEDAVNKAFVSKWAAHGILAKVYLERKGSGDVDKALASLDAIILSGKYTLNIADYASLFRAGNETNQEIIWLVSYSSEVINQGLDFNYVPAPAGERNVVPSAGIIDAFQADSALVVANGQTEVRMAAALERYAPNAYYIEKYSKGPLTASDRVNIVHPGVIILRYADVLLLKAEILNEKGSTPEAIGLIDQVRSRVNLPPTTAVSQADVRLAIERERLLELAFEGHRFWDLRRNERLIPILTQEGRLPNLPEAYKLYWPIPQNEISQNPNLTQNEGY